MSTELLTGWERLRHRGLLLDPPRLQRLAQHPPEPLGQFEAQELRRAASALLAGDGDVSGFVALVLEQTCGFTPATGTWLRGSDVGREWSRRTPIGESVKPRYLWRGARGALLPVFVDAEKQLGIGRGRRAASQVVQWLRASTERLALLTNGRQWRLIFAGLDFDAWCEWDVDLWLEEGEISPQVHALRVLVSPATWTPSLEGQPAPLLAAVLDSRKGQADLSAALGERVREAVELVVQAHGDVLRERCPDVLPANIYRAAVRVVMRLVVVLFAESRELLPRDNALYHASYGVAGLIEELEKIAARGGNRLARSWSAWPRLLALFRLVHTGSHHPALPVPAYGGELFAPADPAGDDDLSKALAVFETAAFDRELLCDREVHRVLERVTRMRVKLRQGRANTWVAVPVDFSDLSSEYIGILYEGLLDFELKAAPVGDPVIFLAVGNQPALPLSRLETMEDKALASLLEKMKDTSKAADEEDAEEGEEGELPEATPDDDAVSAGDEEHGDDEGESEALDSEQSDSPADHRHITRTRAENWARRAVEIGNMVSRPRGRLTPERQQAHEEAISRKARQLVLRVLLPGEWYLVRWGGTRKGLGTFYTRPGLAVPTARRTLRPLAWLPPITSEGTENTDAPAADWTPKPPEQILALKVCDPACGSGTFPVAALRFLTESLYAAVHHHGRVADTGDRSIVSLLGPPDAAAPLGEGLGQEMIPCRPDDAAFEPRLKAVLRRYVVERSIYGVDFDPLAVELCRLALWIETMDRTLPFSFLDHKVKCGNALVGAWFDTFRHYPVMAFKNREGGDKGHGNGVHFKKDARGEALREFAGGRLKDDLVRFLSGPTLFDPRDQAAEAISVHDHTLALLARLHDLPVHDASERAHLYRDELLSAPAYQRIKEAMDLWCSCWFWPVEELADAPLPSTLLAPADATRAATARIAARMRFFHWELEFPDVFHTQGAGFDGMLGNPPWETLQPNSKEFFSNLDPLYRAYGKQEALRTQTRYFADQLVEKQWLDYNADFAWYSNWMKFAGSAFGDPADVKTSGDQFRITRGRENNALHDRWRATRAKTTGYADAAHPFRHRGEGKAYTYKLFLETAHALLRNGGRMGFIVPSGLYSDHGTGALRRLFLDHCCWEWLFGFENKEGIFDIHRSFKFNPIIVVKGGRTDAVRTAFMRRAIPDWEHAEALSVPYTRAQVERFSPKSRAILEIQSAHDLEILEKIYAHSVLLGDDGAAGWGVKYAQGDFNMTSDSRLFPPRSAWEAKGYRPVLGGIWATEENLKALPLLQGAMVWHFDPVAARYAGGGGHAVRWDRIDWTEKRYEPQYLISEDDVAERIKEPWSWRIAYRYLGNSTNQRTFAAAPIRGVACGHTVGVLRLAEGHFASLLFFVAALDSLAFDWVLRLRLGGSGGVTALDPTKIVEAPVPRRGVAWARAASTLSSRLCLAAPMLRDGWLRLNLHSERAVESMWAVTDGERLRIRCMLDAAMFAAFGFDVDDVRFALADCDHPADVISQAAFSRHLNQKGFWRIDKEKDPELRHTVLTLAAFHNLKANIRTCNGNRDAGIDVFLNQNEGDGWMLPETLCLADYGLGQDERSRQPQPVASRLGPRFYDWQLAQSADESWRECHRHARNLLGEAGYRRLLAETEAEQRGEQPQSAPRVEEPAPNHEPQGSLFD